MVLRNDMGENVLESIGQGFGDELVYNVAKAYGSKIRHFLWVACFWDERNVGFIDFRHGQVIVEDIQDHASNTIPNNTPVFLIEDSGHTVGPRGFGGVNLLKGSGHFFSSKSTG